jgi:succinate-semialdehyde dehydrogenase/glutarate-semialdehyde dehydrogenase
VIYRTLNPVTEELLRTYPELSWDEAEVRARGAREAFFFWREIGFEKRRDLAIRLADLLKQRKSQYARLITEEMGKPVTQAETEIEKCAWGCEFYAENAEKYLKEEIIPTDAGKSYVRYDPLGVILGIMPWNFPFWQVFRFAIPAIMAGNGVLLKPAPNVPGCGLAIEALFREAGFPEHLFRCLFLSNENTARLIESPFVQGVSLTGSDRAGSQVAEVAGKSLKKSVLELGGSDPFIVFEDADLEKTILAAIRSRMLNTGQSCIAAKRLILSEKIFDKFEELFVQAVRDLKVGDPKDPATNIGPLAREDLLQNLIRQVEESKGQGAKVIVGAERLKRKGFFYSPTILRDVVPGMTAFDQETFGPVASLIIAKNDEEAIELANRTVYGLGASLWTRDIARAELLARRIEAGSVFINETVKSDPRLPFGGIKRSGYGRELAAEGLREFVNIKTVWIGF